MTATVSEPPIEVSIERPAIYVVATPIGNLGDISYRAVATLKAVDVVYAEDTRLSRRLLDHYGVGTPARSLHEHNERAIATELTARIESGPLACALISDAGTPLISDPGFALVRAAIARGIAVHPVPGPCAALAALCVAGLPTDHFVFEGFLPARQQARLKRLQELANEPRSIVVYESPRRLAAALADLAAVLGHERHICVARELTKLHETCYRGTISQVLDAIGADRDAARGEVVMVIAGRAETVADDAGARRILTVLLRRFPSREAVEIAAELGGAPRNALYRLALELRRARE